MKSWDSMKLAFSVESDSKVWESLGIGGDMLHLIPRDWQLTETDSSGARCVAVFRYSGDLRQLWYGSYLIRCTLDYCQGLGPHPRDLGFLF